MIEIELEPHVNCLCAAAVMLSMISFEEKNTPQKFNCDEKTHNSLDNLTTNGKGIFLSKNALISTATFG